MIPVEVTGTININSKQSVTIDVSSYGFETVPHVWVSGTIMCTIYVTNVTKTSITVDVYNAWGGSILAKESLLGQLQAMELAS